MIYQIETNNWFVQRVIAVLSYFNALRLVSARQENAADIIATQVVEGYKEVQRIKASGEKPKRLSELIREINAENAQ